MDTFISHLGQAAGWRRYFVYRLAFNAERGKFDKTPLGSPAAASMSFADAYVEVVRLRAAGQHATVGLWITAQSGLWFLDIDGLPGDYTPDAQASQLVDMFPGAFVEWSTGKRGLHIVGRMTAQISHACRNSALHLELYSADRGIALNIDSMPRGSMDSAHDITALVSTYFPPRPPATATTGRRPEWRGPVDDVELIQRALKARPSAAVAFGDKASFAQLWRGEVSNDDRSRVDAALASHLAFWTGCDEPRMERLMRQSGLDRPKWREHRTYLARTVASACASCRDVYQEQLPLPRPLPVASRSNRPTVRNAAELQQQQLVPIQWALKDLLPEGVTILSSDPKLGKSWMTLAWCIAIATGKPIWNGRAPEQQGTALLLALEDNDRRMKRRLEALLPAFGNATPCKLFYATDWPRAAAGVTAIRDFLIQHTDTRIVVLDTIAAFREPDPGRKTTYQWDYELGASLKPLSQEFKCAFVLVSHTRKATGGDAHVNQQVSGTQGLTGGVDNVFVLKRSSGNVTAVLHTDGRDIEQQLELALKLQDGHWQFVGNAKDVNRSQQRNWVLEALDRIGGAGTGREIHEAMGTAEKLGTLRVRLTRMVSAGELDLNGKIYTRVDIAAKFAPLVTPPLPGVMSAIKSLALPTSKNTPL